MKKTYGIIFETGWDNYVSEHLTKLGIPHTRAERNKLRLIETPEAILVIGMRPNSPGVAVDIELMKMYYSIKKVFRVGSFGAYGNGIDVGDIILCTDAIRGEGTSKCYVPDPTFPAACDFNLTKVVADKLGEYMPRFHTGTLWTTDGRIVGQYEPEIINDLVEKNVQGVDMESSCFFVLGKIMGMQTANLSVAVDIPAQDKKYLEFSYESPRVSQALRICCQSITDAILQDQNIS